MKRKQFLSKQILFKIKFQSPRGKSRNLNAGYSILRLERTSVFVQKTEILRGRSIWRCWCPVQPMTLVCRLEKNLPSKTEKGKSREHYEKHGDVGEVGKALEIVCTEDVWGLLLWSGLWVNGQVAFRWRLSRKDCSWVLWWVTPLRWQLYLGSGRSPETSLLWSKAAILKCDYLIYPKSTSILKSWVTSAMPCNSMESGLSEASSLDSSKMKKYSLKLQTHVCDISNQTR